MPWGMVSGIAGDLLGALGGGAFSAREAAKNREWQEKMASTQYQRAAKDLEAAGLNRILGIGSPASAGTGAQASHPGASLGSTGIAASTAKENIKLMQDQRTLAQQQAFKALGEGRHAHAEADKAEFTRGIYKALGPELEKAIQRFTPSASDRLHDALNIMENPMGWFMSTARDKVKETPLYQAGEYLKNRWYDLKDYDQKRRNKK